MRQANQATTEESMYSFVICIFEYRLFYREDLQFWIAQMKAQRRSNPDTAGEDLGSPDEIMQTILSVQQQQKQVLERLHNEQLSAEQELSRG